jgi:hypothetical protein
MTATYCHHLLHNTTTIEEGDDIVAVTFFTAKPLKEVMTVGVTIFYNKAIEEGDRICCLLLLLYNTTIEEGTGNSCCHFIFLYNTTTEEGDDNSCHCVLLLCNTTTEEDDNALPSSSSSQA